VSLGYDSNFWRESDALTEANAPVNPVTVLKFGGGVGLRNRNPNRAGIELDFDAVGRYVSAENADETVSPLDESAAFDSASAKLKFALLPHKPVSVDLNADGRYTERPGSEMLKEDGYDRVVATFGPDLRIRPGGRPESRAFEVRLGYRFNLERSLNSLADLGGNRGDKNTHRLRFLTHWKFFPKTALFLDVSYAMVNYRQVVDLDASGNLVDSPNKDLNPLRAELGLEGLITPRLSLILRGGYSNSFQEEGASYSGPIGRFDLEYKLEPRLAIGAGYALKLGNDGFSNYYTLNRAEARTTVNLPARVSVQGSVGFDYYSYSYEGAPEWTYSLPQRVEPILRAKGAISWEAVTWLAIRASWEFENNRSNYYFCLGDDPGNCFAGDPIDLAEYTRHVVMLSVATEY